MNRRNFLMRGFTLIELVIFIVVVSVGIAGILKVSTVVVASSTDPMVRKQAIAVAETMLEEILLKEYAKPTGSTVLGFGAGGSRNVYDCVDDYANYTTLTGIVDATGAATAGLGAFNFAPAISVTTATLGGQTVKWVVVSVTGPQGVITLSGYRGNY
jgi:MSHA pilin protein MshD